MIDHDRGRPAASPPSSPIACSSIRVSDETDLFAGAGLDSLGLVELLLGLEEEFGIDIEAADLELDRFRSIASIASFVCSKLDRRNGHELGPRRVAL